MPLANIPTNLITGFLGVGKTSAILNLLANKPETERWAVLVNEFGEIGIDGSLMESSQGQSDQVYFKEVPGGCMCCTAGLPMQVALNQLIMKAKPDRLLIEPTGLGHPAEVLDVLASAPFAELLDLQPVVTLVDARKLKDQRYLDHPTFNQQIEIADLVVGNKKDLYAAGDEERLIQFVERQSPRPVLFTEHGQLDSSVLCRQGLTTAGPTIGLAGSLSDKMTAHSHRHHSHDHDHENNKAADNFAVMELPESGFVRADNSGEGYISIGWRLSPRFEFKRQQLLLWMTGLDVERLKAVLLTDEGPLGFNLAEGSLSEIPLDEAYESRLELIQTAPEHGAAHPAAELGSQLQTQLFNCLNSASPDAE